MKSSEDFDIAFNEYVATQNGHRRVDNEPDDGYVPPAVSQDNDEPDFELHESWEPIDLAGVLAGDLTQPQPDILLREDGNALLYEGSINGIHGDSGAGKGWLCCFTIVECARRHKRVLMIDYEDNEHSLAARLRVLGMNDSDIVDTLVYVRPQVSPGPHAVEHLKGLIRSHGCGVTIIDSLGECFATEGLDENKDVEVGPWYRRVARPLADTGTALLIIDHSTKASDNPLHPSGSKRKRAAITGASYLAESMYPFVKGKGGRLRLTCAKDRHGNYKRGEVVGELAMTFSAAGTCHLKMDAPALSDGEQTLGVKVVQAARAAIAAVKKEGGAVTRGALEGLMKIKCRADEKRGGIDLAVSRSALREVSGPRGARLYEYIQDLPEPTDSGDNP